MFGGVIFRRNSIRDQVRDGIDLSLPIAADHSLSLMTKGADGKIRGGVPVALRVRTERKSSNRQVNHLSSIRWNRDVTLGGITPKLPTKMTEQIMWSGITGKYGIVRIDHVQMFWKDDAEWHRGMLAFPGRHDEPADVTKADWDGPPVVLGMPPTGSIIVTLVDRAGRPVEAPGRLQLTKVTPSMRSNSTTNEVRALTRGLGDARVLLNNQVVFAPDGNWNSNVRKSLTIALEEMREMPGAHSITVTSGDGQTRETQFYAEPREPTNDGKSSKLDRLSAVRRFPATTWFFPYIGIDQELQPMFTFESGSLTSSFIKGPTKAGESVRIKIVLPDRACAIRGILAQSEEVTIPKKVHLQITRERGRNENWDVTVSEQGAFETVAIRASSRRPPWTLDFDGARDLDIPVRAQAEVASLPESGTIDLGVLEFEPAPTLCSGVVVDDRGMPIERCDVRLVAADASKKNRTRNIAFMRVRTNSDGVFKIFGAPPKLQKESESLVLAFSKRGHVRQPRIPVMLFGEPMRIEIPRMGKLKAQLFLPDLQWNNLFRLEAKGNGHRSSESDGVKTRGPGLPATASLDLQPNLRYDFTVTMRGDPEPFAKVENVLIVPGPDQDIRVTTFDLRGTLFRYDVICTDPSGAPATGASGVVVSTGHPISKNNKNSKSSFRGFTLSSGRATIASRLPNMDVQILANGFRPVKGPLTPGENYLQLAKIFPVNLTFPGLREMLGDRAVRVSMVYKGNTGLPSSLQVYDQVRGRSNSVPRASLGKSGGDELSATNTASVPLSLDGTHEIVLRISESGVSGRESRTVATVEVSRDGFGPQSILVDWDQTVVRQVLELLAEKKRTAKPR